MKCNTVRKWVSQEVDGRPHSGNQALVLAHLQVCPACRAWRKEQQELARWLERPLEETLSPRFEQRVLALIDQENRVHDPRAVWGGGWRLMVRPALLTGLFFLFLLMGLSMGDGSPKESASRRQLVLCNTLQLDWFSDQPRQSFGEGLNGLLGGTLP